MLIDICALQLKLDGKKGENLISVSSLLLNSALNFAVKTFYMLFIMLDMQIDPLDLKKGYAHLLKLSKDY